MSVGLYDADMAAYTLVPFNLELMKLSSYYKRKGEIVLMSNEFHPDRHQQFFYRKDYDDGIFPKDLYKYQNLEYGGLAFSNNKYIPMDEAIECMKPDTSIYNKVAAKMLNGRTLNKKVHDTMLTAEHCRLSLDGETVWPLYKKQFKDLPHARNIIFHDYDLGAVKGSFEEVQKIMSYARNDGWATRIGMKFPVQISTGENLLKWISLRPNSTFYAIRYNGVIDDKTFVEFINKNKERSCYAQLEYYVDASSSSENDFVKNYLRQIFRQIIISRSYRIDFSLKYSDDFFFDKRWARIIDLFNFYHKSLSTLPMGGYLKKIGDDTLYDFAKATSNFPSNLYNGKVMTREEIKQLFIFVRDNYYPLFQDFYECSFNSLGENYDGSGNKS